MQISETFIMGPIGSPHDMDEHYMPHLGDIARAAALRHVKGRHALPELARMMAMRLIPSLCGHMAKPAEHVQAVNVSVSVPVPVPVPASFHGISTGKTVRFHLHRSSSDLRALKSPRLISPHRPTDTIAVDTVATDTVLTDTMVPTGTMTFDQLEAEPIVEAIPTVVEVTIPAVLAEDALHRGTLSLGMSLPTQNQNQAQHQVQDEDDEKVAMMRALSSLNRMGEVQGHGIGAPRTSHGGRLTITVPGRFLKGERMRPRDVMVESTPSTMKGQQPQAAQVKRHAPLVDMATQISDVERMIEVDHTAAVNVRSMLHKLRRSLSELEHRVQSALRPIRPREA